MLMDLGCPVLLLWPNANLICDTRLNWSPLLIAYSSDCYSGILLSLCMCVCACVFVCMLLCYGLMSEINVHSFIHSFIWCRSTGCDVIVLVHFCSRIIRASHVRPSLFHICICAVRGAWRQSPGRHSKKSGFIRFTQSSWRDQSAVIYRHQSIPCFLQCVSKKHPRPF